MEDFAKIFKSPKYGCILVERENNEDGRPQVRFTYRLKDNAFVTASSCLTYPDTDNGAKLADIALRNVDLDAADAMIAMLEETLSGELTNA